MVQRRDKGALLRLSSSKSEANVGGGKGEDGGESCRGRAVRGVLLENRPAGLTPHERRRQKRPFSCMYST